MRALYPGSFNPWHEGHEDIYQQAKKVFDEVHILTVTKETGLLSDYLAKNPYDAIVRGLRNILDFEYERSLKTWYESYGIKIPIVFFVCDPKNAHLSSTIIRSIRGLKSDKDLQSK